MTCIGHLLPLIALLACQPIHAATNSPITMPALFSDGIVLQQGKPVAIWGYAPPGTRITVTLAEHTADPIANDLGVWRAYLGPLEAGGPHELAIRAGNFQHVVKDVQIGELWLWAGDNITSLPEQTERELGPSEIRVFTVPRATKFAQVTDFAGAGWSSAQSAQEIPGAVLAFARSLHSHTRVPIGVIVAQHPGAPIEAWNSEEALRSFAEWGPIMGMLPRLVAASETHSPPPDQDFSEWSIDLDYFDEGYADGKARWADPAMDDASWVEVHAPGMWEEQGFPNLDGFAWYRKSFELPSEWAGKPLQLHLPGANDMHRAWFNGEWVGAFEEMNGSFVLPRVYDVPAHLIRTGKNVVAVRVYDLGNVGGFVGDAKDMRIEIDGDPSSAIALAGPWKFRPGMEIGKALSKPVPPVYVEGNPRIPGVVFNGMIAPLFPYGIRGVVWQHGESNIGRARQYEQLLPSLINDWRLRFQQGDLPFLIAPLAGADQSEERTQLRNAQARALSAPNVGMPDDANASDAESIAKRLADLAAKTTSRSSSK